MFSLQQIRVRRQQRCLLSIDALQLESQQLTVILGHNGCGKSTLMNLLARQSPADEGQIWLQGQPIERYSHKQLARQVAYLPQHLPDVSGLSVRELVRLGRFPWRGSFGRWQALDHAQVDAALSDTHLEAFADQPVDSLSGGERQRAWVAMLLAQQSPLLLLDEPTSALDPVHQYELMTLLQQLHQTQQRGIVVILHDLNLALRYAQRILVLRQGQVVFDGSPWQLLAPQRLHALYGKAMQVIDHPQLTMPLVAMG